MPEIPQKGDIVQFGNPKMKNNMLENIEPEDKVIKVAVYGQIEN